MAHNKSCVRFLVPSKDMELTSRSTLLTESLTDDLPAAQCGVSHFDNDISGLLNLRDRSLRNLNFELVFEDNCLHSFGSHVQIQDGTIEAE